MLHDALYCTCNNLKAAAPMIPFMTEDIYRNLVCTLDANAPESVHLCDFPEVNEAHIDKKLEEDMETVLEAVVIGRAAVIQQTSRIVSQSEKCISKQMQSFQSSIWTLSRTSLMSKKPYSHRM